MVNSIWLGFLLSGVIVAVISGKPEVVIQAVTEGSQLAVKTSFEMMGTIGFWLGLLRIAENAGLISFLSRVISPFVIRLFPDVPREHPAIGSILLNISANMLGLGNAATPMGLKAMEQLQELNPNPDTATDSMCTLLAINTSGVTLIPAMVIAVRSAAGSKNPTEILGTTIIATTCSTFAALLANTYYKNRGTSLGRGGK